MPGTQRNTRGPVVVPDFSAKYGSGSPRAIVISGGGLAGLAWGAAYLNGLTQAGVNLRDADLVVGTSAGSILGTEVLSNDLGKFTFLLKLAARTRLFEFIRRDSNPKPTAAHARALFDDSDNGRSETLIKIGHAALAAEAPHRYRLFAQIAAFVGRGHWPSRVLRTTCYDTYTGERLVLSKESGVPLITALGASTAVPGLMSPVHVGERRCMDGGMASGLNSDLIAGAQKALVVGLVHDPRQGKWTSPKDQWDYELGELTKAGTDFEAVLPAEDLGDPMDATALPLGLRLGAEQARADSAALAKFWNAG